MRFIFGQEYSRLVNTLQSESPSLCSMQTHSVKPLTNAIIQLVMEEAFFGHVLQNLSRQMTSDVPTAAVRLVGPATELLGNPHFFNETLSARHRQGVLRHEVLL